MLVNLLYRRGDLDLEMLDNIGGICEVLTLFTVVRSCEARDNLFVVLFDYVTSANDDLFKDHQYQFGDYESAAILELLKEVHAPQLFVGFVNVIPSSFVEHVLDHVLPVTSSALEDAASTSGDATDVEESMRNDTPTPPSTPPPASSLLSVGTSSSPPRLHMQRLEVLRSHITRKALSIFLHRFEALVVDFHRVHSLAPPPRSPARGCFYCLAYMVV